MRVIWSVQFTPEQLQATGKVPPGYALADPGMDKRPGLYGEGFGGEAVVCLLPDDDGAWYTELATDPECPIHRAA